MSEAVNYVFSHKEIAEILVKKEDIHEGFWSIYMEFGLVAGNVAITPEESSLTPSAIIPVNKIGIIRHTEPNPLTVDAAIVNPIKAKKK